MRSQYCVSPLQIFEGPHGMPHTVAAEPGNATS
jgi:hypothetical protein